MKAKECLDILVENLLGKNYYITDPVGGEQANVILTHEILTKHSKQYRKEGRNLIDEDYIRSTDKIKCAAIKYFLKIAPDEAQVTWGANHGQCIEWFGFAGYYSSMRCMDKEIQGFLTTSGRFVDRREAYQIAKRQGQLINDNEKSLGEGVLDSYNVRFADVTQQVE